MKRRVLHLINTFSIGGAEMHLRSLVAALRDRYSIRVAFLREEAKEARSLTEDFQVLGIPTTDLGMRGSLDPIPLARIAALLERYRFDVVHTHLPRADLYGLTLGRLLGVPALVSTVHNVEPTFYRWPSGTALRFAYSLADRIVAISDTVRRVLLTDLAVPSDRVRVIPYGFDPTVPVPRAQTLKVELGMAPADPLIGTVGRLAAQKGHRYLIEAMAKIRLRFPTAKAVIVGHDDEGLRPVLEREIHAQGLTDAVILLGFVDAAAGLIPAFDVFVLPSLWEGLGLVLLEAMAASVPIVATRVAAIPEIVVDGTCGVLVPAKDADALAAAVVDMLQRPQEARRMAQVGRQRVQEHFSIPVMAARVDEMYEQLLRRFPSSHRTLR